MVAIAAVDRAAHGVAQHAVLHGLRLDLRVQLESRVKGRLAGLVLHQLHAPEQAAATDVANMRVAVETGMQLLLQVSATRQHLRHQVVALDHFLHRQRSRSGHGVANVSVAVLEQATALAHGFHNLVLRQYRANRLVAAAQAFGDGHQVGADAFLLYRVQAAGAAHAAHHLVSDQQDAIAVAQRAQAFPVTGWCRHGAQGGAHHGLGHKGDDLVGAQFLELGIHLGQQTGHIGFGAFAGLAVAVFVSRGHAAHVHQDRGKLLATPFVAAHRQRAQGVAVVALAARYKMRALRLADFHKILARHFQRSFHRFRAARDKIHIAHASGRVGHQVVSQLFLHIGGEKAGVGVGELVNLAVHGRHHIGLGMAQAGDCRTAAGVDIGLARLVEQLHPFAADGDQRNLGQRTMDDVAHARALLCDAVAGPAPAAMAHSIRIICYLSK